MFKIDFEKLTTDYNLCFEDFYDYATKSLDLSADLDATEVLKDELFKLFATTLIEVMSKAVTQEERLAITEYLEMHPDVNILDVYFSFAILNADIQNLLNASLNDVVSTVDILKAQINK